MIFYSHRPNNLIVILIMMSGLVYGQNGDREFVHYTVRDGLSNDIVTSITQDAMGYIWIGTHDGLNRFDGNHFEKYFRDDPSDFLLSSKIRKVEALDDRRLLVATSNGFHIVHIDDFSVKTFWQPDSSAFGALRNLLWDVVELTNGQLAVTNATGFYLYNPDGSLDFQYDHFTPEDIGHKRLLYGRTIFLTTGNEILIYVKDDSLAIYDRGLKRFRMVDRSESEWAVFQHPITNPYPNWISENQIDTNEFILLGHRDSLIYYHLDQEKRFASPIPIDVHNEFNWESKVFMLNDSNFIINSGRLGYYEFKIDRKTGRISGNGVKHVDSVSIQYVFLDKNKRLWLGGRHGLWKQKISPPAIRSYYRPITGTPYGEKYGGYSAGKYSDALTYKGKVYITRQSGEFGLVVFDSATLNMIDRIQFLGSFGEYNYARSVRRYYNDTLWIGTNGDNGGIIWLDTKTNNHGVVKLGREGGPPFSILGEINSDGYAWLCSHNAGVIGRYNVLERNLEVFNTQTSPALPVQRIKNLTYDSYGDVWFGGSSLIRWNNTEEHFDTVISSYGGPNKHSYNILTLRADDSGSLWMHNAENGLLQYCIREKTWKHFGRGEGLPTEAWYGMSPVIDNTLWLAGYSHLMRLNTNTSGVEIFDYKDGLLEGVPGEFIAYDSSSQLFYAFYVDAITRMPLHLSRSTTNESHLLIERLEINNRKMIYFPKGSFRLSSKEKNLVFHYTILDYEDANQYLFSYRTNDSEWVEVGNQRYLNLLNLRHGDYKIDIKATDKAGREEIATLTFTIAPPLWLSPWVIALCVSLIFGILYTYFNIRIAHYKLKANQASMLSKSEMKALHAQMNPHFIFNSLNSIHEMVINQENDDASEYLIKFSQLIRTTLDQSTNNFISLRDTVDYLKGYIEMEQVRNADFTCKIHVDPQIDQDETVLPPMLIQPFIENAIWHGTIRSHQHIDIVVDFYREGDHLVCTIDDNGIGIEEGMRRKVNTTRNSIGISNVRNRIELLNQKHGKKGTIQVEDKSSLNGGKETGTRVTLRLPIEVAEV